LTWFRQAVAAHQLCAGWPKGKPRAPRYGRKRVYLTGAILTGVIAFPYFAVLNHGGYALIFIAIVLSLVLHAMQYGPQAALIGESFPTHLRYGGAGIGYQLASVFAGGPAPLLANWLLHETGTPYSISVYIIVAAVVTVACVRALPDRSRANIGRHRRLQPCLEGRPDQRTQRRLRPTR
jgi:MFS family permease